MGNQREKRTRVLFIAHIANPHALGGACKSLLSMVVRLAEKYHPLVVCPNEGMLPEVLRQKGIAVEIGGRPVWSFLFPYSGLAAKITQESLGEAMGGLGLGAIIRQFKPKIVHVNSMVCPREALTAKGMGVPVVWHIREALPPGPGRGEVLHLVHQTAHKVLAISKAVIETFNEEKLCRKVELLYNGFEVPTSLPKAQEPGNGKYPLVGYVGTLAPHKGVQCFIQAADLVRKKVPRVRFVISGHDWGTGYGSQLLMLTKRLGLEHHLRFLGFNQCIEEVIAGLDVLAVPSVFQEPFGRVAVEGMLMDKPVIASAVGGLKEIVEHGVTGLLVPPLNPEALAERVIELIRDRKKAKAMGRQGKERALRLFLIEDKIKRLDEIYQEQWLAE
ncbi:MAG: glycosyltransferase family 4 protein [Bacillota bacterium]